MKIKVKLLTIINDPTDDMMDMADEGIDVLFVSLDIKSLINTGNNDCSYEEVDDESSI